MSENAAQNKGKRFADDLRRIRKRRGVSIDEVHEETKIPRGLIEAFEESGLLDHPMFNRVYLRSFVRTYARVVDISPAFTLRALEEVLDGTYRGRLAEEYLEESEAVEDAASAQEVEQPARGEAEEEPAEEAVSASEEAGREESGEQQDVAGEEEEASEPETATRAPETQPASSTKRSKAEAASGAAVGAAANRTPTEGQRQRGARGGKRSRRRRDSGSSARRQGIYLGAALLVIAIGGWLLFSVLSGDSADVEDGQAEAVAADTVVQEDTVSAEDTPAGPTEPVDIGEAMDFRVIAAQGPIRELRVKVDEDARRPYWIEEGDDRTFSAENQIAFSPPIEATNEQPMEVMELELEDYPYPTTERDSEGRIVVTRDRAQSYLDSLVAAQQ